MRPHIGLGCSSLRRELCLREWTTRPASPTRDSSRLCRMMITAPSKSKRTVTSRNTKAVSVPDFQADVKCFADRYSQCPDRDLVDSYSAGLRAVMDHHAHLVTRCVSHRRSAPWLTDKVREARRRRRQAERRWRSTRLTVHREIFVKERATVKRCIRDAR